MGTLRWEKEAEDSARKVRQRTEFDQKRRELEFAEASTGAQIRALQLDLQRQRAELAMYSGQDDVRTVTSTARETELRKRRSADLATDPSAGKSGNGAAK